MVVVLEKELVVVEAVVIVLGKSPNKATIIGDGDRGTILGEELCLGVVIALETMEEWEENGIWDVACEVGEVYFCELGSVDSSDGGMRGRSWEHNGEGGEEMVGIDEAMGGHGLKWRRRATEKLILTGEGVPRRLCVHVTVFWHVLRRINALFAHSLSPDTVGNPSGGPKRSPTL